MHLLACIKATPPDISFWIEPVKLDGLVVIIDSLEGIAEEKIACASVEICGRVLRLFPYVSVEILDGLVELLGKEICHSTAEIQADISGTEVDGLLKVRER